MRKGFLFIVSALAVTILMGLSVLGCTDKKSVANESDSIDSTASTVAADTLEQIISETPMPKAADELFDDFFFNFAANKKLQRKRIKFPLTVTKKNGTSTITAKQWTIDNFFMKQDFYTLIFDNQRQMDIVKDTTVGHVIVEKIYLKKHTIKQYLFDRENGQWQLTAINYEDMSKSENASFLNFYCHFATDSAYQVHNINDPLQFSGPDPDNDFGTMNGILAPEQWPSFAPELPHGVIYNILYGQKYGKSQQKIFIIRGIANGLETELTFKKKNGQWKLTKLII